MRIGIDKNLLVVMLLHKGVPHPVLPGDVFLERRLQSRIKVSQHGWFYEGQLDSGGSFIVVVYPVEIVFGTKQRAKRSFGHGNFIGEGGY